jgi:hypothetical protein
MESGRDVWGGALTLFHFRRAGWPEGWRQYGSGPGTDERRALMASGQELQTGEFLP